MQLGNFQRLSATSKAEIKATHMVAAIFKSKKKCGLCLQRCLCSRRHSILSNSWEKQEEKSDCPCNNTTFRNPENDFEREALGNGTMSDAQKARFVRQRCLKQKANAP